MSHIDDLVNEFTKIANNPRAQLDSYLADGKRAIGVVPYYAPEELVHAAGGVPFGLWGRLGTANAAKKYFPTFYCSICQMDLEMGLDGELEGLSGVMIPQICDTLKAFGQNWKAGVNNIPMIFVSQPLNRDLEVGHEYALESYAEVRDRVEECCDAIIDDDALRASIKLYNEWRKEMKHFLALAGTHPVEISNAARVAVVNAGYYELKDTHLARLKELNAELEKLPSSQDGYKKIVLSGIYEDIPSITQMLDEFKYDVVADDLAKESRALSIEVSEDGDPLKALAEGWCGLDGDPLLYDPEKTHLEKVIRISKENDADGVIVLLAKFCDPEEFEVPMVREVCKDAGIPTVTIEVDQQTESYGQARTQLEAFSEIMQPQL